MDHISTLDAIPGGQGTASLFVRRTDMAVCFKDKDGQIHEVYRHVGSPVPGEAVFAMHLGETLPTLDD